MTGWSVEILREVVNRRVVPLELRPSHDRRLEAYRERFVAALGTDPLDLEDVTAEELIITLVEGALEQDERAYRLIADFEGRLHPYPLWQQARGRVKGRALRLRRKSADVAGSWLAAVRARAYSARTRTGGGKW